MPANMTRNTLLSLTALIVAMPWHATYSQDVTEDEAGEALWEIFEAVQPSVVSLSIFDSNNRQINRGSGFVVGDNGLIATNIRIIEGVVRIEMTTSDGGKHDVSEIAAVDTNWGIALLRTTKDDLSPLKLAQQGTTRVGQDIVAIGSPQGVNVTLSQGVIVGLLEFQGREDLMQLSNDVSAGMTGGPILDNRGEVVGLAASTFDPNRRPVNLAIPSSAINALVASSAGAASFRNLNELQQQIEETREELARIRGSLEQSCSGDDVAMIDSVIQSAISSGVGIYNGGDFLGCFRIYQGASYQILYRLESRCEIATQFLEKALFEAAQTKFAGRYPTIPAAQAWVMRGAFDSLLGATIPPADAPTQADGDIADNEKTGT